MDIEQLEEIGREVAVRLKEELGLDQLDFKAGRGGLQPQTLWATGVMVKGGTAHGYSIAHDQLEPLLSSPEPEVRRLLQAYLEGLAQQLIGVRRKG